ncbi:MAG: cellulase family glycosylhydrolase [Chryseolinea sp.]
MKSRDFIKSATLAATAVGVSSSVAIGAPKGNTLPRWKGFNLLDFFSPDPISTQRKTVEDHLMWMQDWGFNFVRLPMAYPAYLDFDRTRNITPEEVYKIKPEAIDQFDNLVSMAMKHNMQVKRG